MYEILDIEVNAAVATVWVNRPAAFPGRRDPEWVTLKAGASLTAVVEDSTTAKAAS